MAIRVVVSDGCQDVLPFRDQESRTVLIAAGHLTDQKIGQTHRDNKQKNVFDDDLAPLIHTSRVSQVESRCIARVDLGLSPIKNIFAQSAD